MGALKPENDLTEKPPEKKPMRSYLRRDWPGLAACALLSLCLTLLAIHWSSEQGKLTHDIQYDDVLHFVDGLDLYNVFETEGFIPAVRYVSHDPTLAPLSTLTVAVSFAVFGVKPWAPYAANGVVLLLALWTVWALTARFPLWLRICAVLWFLSVPMAWSALGDFKPNFLSSLLLLVGMLALLEWWLLDAPPSLLPIAAGCVAFSIIAKPPFFPYVGFTLCFFSVGLLVLRRISAKRSWFPPGTRWQVYLLAAGVGLLIVLPYALTGGEVVLKMLMEHIAPGGKYNDVWTSTIKRHSYWLYFFTGHGGVMLGTQLWLAIALWAASLLALLHSNRTYKIVFAAVLWLLLLAYLPPTLTEVKHRFTGLMFQLLFVLGPVYLLALRFQQSGTSFGKKSTSISMAGAAIIALIFMDPIRGLGGELYPPEQGREQQRLVRDLLQSIEKNYFGTAEPKLVLFTTGLINSNTLDWVARSEDYPIDIPPSGNIVTLRKTDLTTKDADFILAADPDALGTYKWHPLTKQADKMFLWLEESGDFEMVYQAETSEGGNFKLYRRKPTSIADPGRRP